MAIREIGPRPGGSAGLVGRLFLALAPVGVRLRVDPGQPLVGQVGVDLGGGEVLVPEELLDHSQVRAAVEEVGGERVSERVRARLAVEPRAVNVLVQDLPDRAVRQPVASMSRRVQGRFPMASREGSPTWPR